MTIDENYIEKLCNTVAKTLVEAFERLTIDDVNMYQLGYNKAIDDFMDRLLAERTQCYNFDDSEHNNPIKCVWWNDIEGIAEQLVKRRW